MNSDFRTGAFSDSQQDELLDQIDVRCHTNVAAVRESAQHQIRIRVEIREGNVCDRRGMLGEMKTSELTSRSLTGIASQPLMVGNVFQLVFDHNDLDAPPELAVCDRCAMLGDSSFELRFRFAQPVDISGCRQSQ